MDPSYPLLAAMVLALGLIQVNQRLASPVLAIVIRWMRWFIFSFGIAYLLREFDLVDRHYAVLCVICFLLWFLLETLYNWLAITAMSLSPMPLFPRFQPNPGGDEWPLKPRILKIRDWLRAEGFRHIQALRSEIAPGVHLRVSVYDNLEGSIRAQITFMPETGGSVSLGCVLSSQTDDGTRIITDNLHTPFGGFYPSHWEVRRVPWLRSPKRLMELHKARLSNLKTALEPITRDPYSDICGTQLELDRLNTELGFLVPQADREERGKITQEGRYRVWKEIWLLDYLGICPRHS